jgi:hypothetical protein
MPLRPVRCSPRRRPRTEQGWSQTVARTLSEGPARSAATTFSRRRWGGAEDTLRAVEQGQRVVEDLTSEQVVAWIGALHVDRTRAGESLRLAIAFETGHPRAAASASAPIPAAAQGFIEEVLKLLHDKTN